MKLTSTEVFAGKSYTTNALSETFTNTITIAITKTLTLCKIMPLSRLCERYANNAQHIRYTAICGTTNTNNFNQLNSPSPP